MSSDVTILVNSCDKYEDAWHPFFECLWHFAGDLPYPIVLNTETKQYSSPHYAIHCVNTPGRQSWSSRLRHVLDSVETEFVFFLLEDYFLKDRFDARRFESVIDYMKTRPDVAIVDIAPRWADSPEEMEAVKLKYRDLEDYFEERNSQSFNITCAPGVWRTDALRSLLRAHEDAWDFEIYVGIRAKKAGWKVIRYYAHTPTIYEYDFQVWTGMGITAGHWLPKNPAFFENLGIKVNFDRLGILNVSSVDEIRAINQRNPAKQLKKIPKKLRKRLTRKKSLS